MTLCLQGGGEFSPACRDMDADLLRRAGGRVVVTALACSVGDDYRTATAHGVRHFRELGATDVVGAPDAREDAGKALAVIRTARLLVLPGGSPARLLEALEQVGAAGLIADLVADGVVVMGASAGAMVLCAWTVLPDRPSADGSPAVVPGLGLVPSTVVVPHWSPDADRPDWSAAIRRTAPPGTTVLGLAEESGVLVEGSTWTPVGRSPARLLDEPRELPLEQPWSRQGSTL